MNDYLQVKELYHHGIKGQKWGIRRYQNEDGSLTKEGYARYKEDIGKLSLKEQKKAYKSDLVIAEATRARIKIPRPKDLYERREKNDKKLSDIYYKTFNKEKRNDKMSMEETAYWIVNDDGHMLIIDEAKRSGKDTSKLELELSKLEDEWIELHDSRYEGDIVKYPAQSSIVDSRELVRQAYGRTVQEAVNKDDRLAKSVAATFITILGATIIGSLGYTIQKK